jgi:hypothetical protein
LIAGYWFAYLQRRVNISLPGAPPGCAGRSSHPPDRVVLIFTSVVTREKLAAELLNGTICGNAPVNFGYGGWQG